MLKPLPFLDDYYSTACAIFSVLTSTAVRLTDVFDPTAFPSTSKSRLENKVHLADYAHLGVVEA